MKEYGTVKNSNIVTATASLYFYAVTSDVLWAQKVADARNQYFAAVAEAVNEYNDLFFNALESYNNIMREAEIERMQSHFHAADEHSQSVYALEADYALDVFLVSREQALAHLDAAIARLFGHDAENETEIDRHANNELNERFVEHFLAQLGAETAYFNAIAEADEKYYCTNESVLIGLAEGVASVYDSCISVSEQLLT